MTRQKGGRQVPAVVAAVLAGDLAHLRTLVQAGANVDEPDSDGRTALQHAATAGSVDVASVLLAAGADVHAADRGGWSALYFAAQGHNLGVASVLLEAGARVDAVDEHGNTPLFRAVFESRGRGEAIMLLLRFGADASRKNAHGVSPLELAETIANYQVKRWLVTGSLASPPKK